MLSKYPDCACSHTINRTIGSVPLFERIARDKKRRKQYRLEFLSLDANKNVANSAQIDKLLRYAVCFS
jgi:hypothetical protein